MADEHVTDTLRRDREYWEAHAQHDPLWAILSDPARKGRRWTTQQFFETGRREISLLMQDLARLGHPVERRCALDFGCGVGRLSLALSSYFGQVTGIDISPKMVELARELHANRDRLHFVAYDGTSVARGVEGPFDLIYSDIVLQHVPPDLALRYVAEFVGLLANGGVAVFQLPSTRRRDDAAVAAPSPMAHEAYTHSLHLETDVPADVRAGRVELLRVRVVNTSPCVWDQTTHGSLRLGNHWLDASSGSMVVQDDGRVPLPERLMPGESVGLVLEITPPASTGGLVCELDLVHEGITWFGDRGATTVRQQVDAGQHSDPSTVRVVTDHIDEAPLPSADIYGLLSGSTTEPADFPMHGIPRDDVIAHVARAGGKVLHTEPDDRGGHEWLGFRYFVVR